MLMHAWWPVHGLNPGSTDHASCTCTTLLVRPPCRWDKHHPGSEEVTLTLNGDRVDMSVRRLSPPNQPYKPDGMLKVRGGRGMVSAA